MTDWESLTSIQQIEKYIRYDRPITFDMYKKAFTINTDITANRSMLKYEFFIVELFKQTDIYHDNINNCGSNLKLKVKLKDAYNYIIYFLKNTLKINIDFYINDTDFKNNINSTDLNNIELQYEYVWSKIIMLFNFSYYIKQIEQKTNPLEQLLNFLFRKATNKITDKIKKIFSNININITDTIDVYILNDYINDINTNLSIENDIKQIFIKKYLEFDYTIHPEYDANLSNLKKIFADFEKQTQTNLKNSNFIYLDTEKLHDDNNIIYNFDITSDFSSIEEIEIIKLIIVEIFKDTKYYTDNNITVNTIENIKLHIHSILKKKLEKEKINYNANNDVINKIDKVIKKINDIFNSSFSLSTRDNIITFLKNIIVYFVLNEKYANMFNINNTNNNITVANTYLKEKLKINDIKNYLNNTIKLTNDYISNTIIIDVMNKITPINISANVKELSDNLNNLINFLKEKANENNITISFDKPITEILSILYNRKKLYEKYTNLLNNLNKLNDKFLNITTKTLIQQPAAPAPAAASAASAASAAATATPTTGGALQAASAASAAAPAAATAAAETVKVKYNVNPISSVNKNIQEKFKVFYELLGHEIVFKYKYNDDYLKNEDKDFKKLIRDIYEDNKLIEDTSDLYLFLIHDQFYLTRIFKLLIENSNLKELLNNAYDLLDIRINDEEKNNNNKYKESISYIKKRGSDDLIKILKRFEGIKQRIESGQPITRREKERFKGIIDELESEKLKITDKETIANIDEVIKYINTKKLTEKVNDIDESLIIEGYKKIIDFSSIASMFKIVVMFLILLCVFLYLFVLFISVFNVFNLIVRIIFDIIQIFYNKNISNNETLLYNIKSILNCSKDDYSDDILNVLNEQSMSLSVFNTTIYIIYILVFYALIYLLFRFYALMKIGHKFIGHPKDIDPEFELLIILGAILGFSIIHYIYYKIIYKELSYKIYTELNNNENEIDEFISNIFKNGTIKDNKQEFDNFFDILKEPSRRNELDIIISDKVLKLNNDWRTTSDLLQYLLIYDIYLYFEDNIILNNDIIELINIFLIIKIYGESKLDKNQKEKLKNNTFISFLDANERKLIKKYHEQLPFYETIPDDKLNYFIEINKELGKTIGNINKKIIEYKGSFYPFLFACIYIITICIFNFICVYVIMGLIANAKNSLPEIIINIANKYLKYCDYILSFIVYKER